MIDLEAINVCLKIAYELMDQTDLSTCIYINALIVCEVSASSGQQPRSIKQAEERKLSTATTDETWLQLTIHLHSCLPPS